MAKPKKVRIDPGKSSSEQHGLASDFTRDPKANARPKRISMNQGQNLDLPGVELDWENYHYYWFADNPQKPGRIQQALAAYWEFKVTASGEKYTRPAGAGTQYLMQLERKYWEEDLLLKKEKVQRTMDAEASIGRNEYAPDTNTGKAEGGSSAITRHTTDNPYG